GEIASLLPPGPLGLRGSSMGGYVALVAAAPVGASAVIAICPAPGRGLAAGLRVGAFDFAADPAVVESLEEADELEAVRSLRCPLLLLHAEEDEVVPFALSERLVDVAPEGLCRFVAVPGGHHRSTPPAPEFHDLSVRYRLESFAREALAGCADGLELYLRIAPGVSPDTHPAISTGGPNTKFGFDLEHAPAAIERAAAIPGPELAGLHFHVGSQVTDLDSFERALERLVPLGEFPAYNLGGGLAAAYTAADRVPSIADYAAAKAAAVEAVFGPGKRVLDEPGRALVANGCVTLYRVESVKRNVDTYVAVDGGMSDNLRPMLYGALYEAQIADRPGGGTRCHVVGQHCESGDIIVRDADLADPAAGDLLVTPATGAYGHAMANNYNGALRPPVVFVRDGDARCVLRRESVADLLGRNE
ncbi:MAG: hypothetical protein ACKOFC_03310, partial [Solirubrobacterales bacterium]